MFGGISGAGTATIDFGGKLRFVSATGIAQNVTFANVGSGKAILEFDAAASTNPNLIYDGVISGFSSPSDQIDFRGLSFAGNTKPTKTLVNGNTILTITEGADSVSVTLAGNRLASNFVAKDDASGGTLIVDPPTQTSPQNPLNNIASLLGQFIASWTNPSVALTSEVHLPLASELQIALS